MPAVWIPNSRPSFYSEDPPYDDFDFSIYSRNGQQIFYSNNPDYGWDGKYNNNMCPIGEYSYIIKVLDIFGKEYLKKGTILLCE